MRTTSTQIQRLALHANLSLRDARDVEQIVDEADHVLRLPLDDRLRPQRLLGPRLHALQDEDAVADRRERIAQLVREHAQEVILALVRFDQRVALGAQLLALPRQLFVLAVQLFTLRLELFRLRVQLLALRLDLLVLGVQLFVLRLDAARTASRSSSVLRADAARCARAIPRSRYSMAAAAEPMARDSRSISLRGC